MTDITNFSLQYEDATVLATARLLEDPVDHNRINALTELMFLEPHIIAVFAGKIVKCLTDKKPAVAWFAVKALGKLNSEDFIQYSAHITKALKGAHPLVRQALMETVDRLAPVAEEFDKFTKHANSKFKSEASQVRVMLMKREEERKKREADDFAKMMEQRKKNQAENAKRRQEWEAEKKAQADAKAAAAEETSWKKRYEEKGNFRKEAEAAIQSALDEKKAKLEEVEEDLADKEQDAIARKLQEAKELAMAKKKSEKEPKEGGEKKDKPVSAARQKAAERAKQRKKG